MKVEFNLNKPNNIRFEGYKPIKSDFGKREYEFNFPFDDTKYECYVELFPVKTDEEGNFYISSKLDNFGNLSPLQNHSNPEKFREGIKLQNGKTTRVNLSRDYDISDGEAFAYHYKFYHKSDTSHSKPFYKLDAGNIIDDTHRGGRPHDKYNIVAAKNTKVTKGGAMKLIIPDINNVIWVYDDKNNIIPNPNIDKVNKMSKNYGNKFGGSLAGIEKDLEEGKLDNFSRIVTLPLFTDDSLTAHAYWNKNNFQIAHSLGNINNYISLQKKLFAKGINLVSDGAYVNEGLEGIHFKHVLQWGEKSPYFNWFKISVLDTKPVTMGVFGEDLTHVTHRLVNSKYKYEQKPDGTIKVSKNHHYKSSQPTYIQIYDDRLVDAEKLSDKQLIKAYDKLPQEHLDINNHNDTVIPYSFRIDSETYKKNVELLNEYNKSAEKKVNYKSPDATRILTQFEYFGLGGKHESGFETWDANPDIAKLHFVSSHNDTPDNKNLEMKRIRREKDTIVKHKNYEVQDYAISSAKFWTKKTNDILNLNVAQHLKNIDGKNADEIFSLIKNQSDGKIFPKDLPVTKTIVRNVINNRYELKGLKSDENYNDTVLRNLMDVPLDSIELGDDIASALASPYVTKRATDESQIGVSRYEMFKQGNPHLKPAYTQEYADCYNLTDKMYKNEMSNFAKEILNAVDEKLPQNAKLKDNSGNLTDFGKYALPLLTQEVARFGVIKSIVPNVEYSYDKTTGEIRYDYKTLKNTNLLSIGIIADSPENEAISVINKIKSGLKKIIPNDRKNLIDALYKSIKGLNADSFKLAEMIVDRTEAGLDWRIDATKDIADIEALRNGRNKYTDTWDQIISFWTKFSDAVKEYHPTAYMAAEVTNESDGHKSTARFGSTQETVKKLLNEAGFTTTANYNYLANGILQIFGKLFEEDGSQDKGYNQDLQIQKQLLASLSAGGPLENLLYTYTFAGNHDKCRALDGYAMDMDLVYKDLTNPYNYEYRERAFRILNAVPYGQNVYDYDVNNFNFDRISGLNIAKCESIASGMGRAKEVCGFDDTKKKYVYDKMLSALKNISRGKFKGKNFEAEAFGTKDYNAALDIVLDEMEYLENDKSKCLSNFERENLKSQTLEKIIDPAMSKLLGQTKFLVALIGNPTLFGGDEYGATGYEWTTKNISLQNRNKTHEEWAEKEFVNRFKKHLDTEFNLRKRPELHPLNDGAPFILTEQTAKKANNEEIKVSAVLRQSTDGAMTISLFNTNGINHKFDEYYSPQSIYLDSIKLSESEGGRVGLACGLKPGTKFLNAKNKEEVYYVNENNEIKKLGNKSDKIEISDSTLILYHIPENQPTFTGKKTLYNPKYNIVSNPYLHTSKPHIGEKLSLLN